MKRFILVASLLVGGSLFAAETVNLEVGAEKVVAVGHYDRVVVTQPEIASVSGAAEGIKIIARSRGVATVLVWKGQQKEAFTVVVKGGKAEAKGQTEEPTIHLAKGEQKVLKLDGISRVAVGDPEIADVRADNEGELSLSGGSEGKTTLLVWKKDGSRVSYLVNVSGQLVSNPRIELKLGESKDLTFGPVSRIAIGDQKIADVQLREHFGLTFRGVAEGQTVFRVWSTEGVRTDYDVVVSR